MVEQFRTHKEAENSVPFRCSIGMGAYSVNVFSEIEDFMPYFKGGGMKYIPWIPGWHVEDSPTPTDYSLVFIPNINTEFDYQESNKTLTIRGDVEDFSDGQAIAYLGFWLMEAQRQRDSRVTSHACALTKDGKGVLIFGERGDGKTSVALSLGLKKGYQLIANDLAIIGYNQNEKKVTLYDGTKIFGLRLSAIRGRFPELLHLFQDTTKESWTTRTFVYPADIGIEVENNATQLSKAFMVHLDSTKADKLSVWCMDDLWIKNYLYENFSRYLRATAIVPFGAKSRDFVDYIPSLDNQQLHGNRLNLIKHLINETQILNVSGGNLDEMAQFIDKETSR